MKGFLAIIALILFVVISGCDKNEVERTAIFRKWEATTFMSIESMSYAKNNNYNPVIEFKTDGTYSLKLDLNQCMGSFSASNDNQISITPPGCTKMCCDSQFSQRFTQLLESVKSFEIDDGVLKLVVPGWGWIELTPTK